jgi:hypothetical protein
MILTCQSSIFLRPALPGLGLAALLLLSGCGDNHIKTFPVEGTITYNGKAVPGGSIMFQPKDNKDAPAATANIKDGRYVLKTYRDGDGAVLGEHTVTVISLEDQSGRLPEERNPLPPAVVPLKYRAHGDGHLPGRPVRAVTGRAQPFTTRSCAPQVQLCR